MIEYPYAYCRVGYKYFHELPIWQESVQMAAEIYQYMESPVFKYDFRIKDQMRAAAVSVVSNISEGFEYKNDRQFVRFLTYAKGSCSELASQLAILRAAGMIPEKDHMYFSEMALSLARKIGGLIQYLLK